ncbi:hypothetical protein [Demequina soli]|uniref:hypothetical protein n=1 Tax=Demequina soli TaxID=1638987 RepID=UPI000780A529|nr:hypothetical protein [Demequina soli]
MGARHWVGAIGAVVAVTGVAALVSAMSAPDAAVGSRAAAQEYVTPAADETVLAAKARDDAAHAAAAATAAPVANSWPVGIFDDPEAPASGSELLGTNRWVGVVDGVTMAAWAGVSGTDPTLGRVLVATDDGTGAHEMIGLEGVGRLTIVSEDAGSLYVVDEHGDTHVLDLRARAWTS